MEPSQVSIYHHPMRDGPSLRAGMLRLAVLLLLLAVPWAAAMAADDPWADFAALQFHDLTTTDGLPNDKVSAVAQDKAGQIWIGTLAGVARYDGYRMHQWESAVDDSDRLPETYVRALMPLSDGGMLIALASPGLARYDPVADRFVKLGSEGGPAARIYAIAPAHDTKGDAAWVAADDGLFLWRGADNTLRPVPLVDKAGRTLNPRLFAVMEEANGDLWVGGTGGLLHRRAGESYFSAIRAEGPAAGTINANVWVIHRDGLGRLWVGSDDAGVAYLAADGTPHAVAGLTGPGGLAGRHTIRDIAEVPDHGLWIATDGAGLIILDQRTGRLRQVRHDPVLASSLNGDRLRNIMVDKTGNVWLSTEQGVERYDPYATRIRVVPATPLAPTGLSGPEVYVAHVDARGQVWLGLADSAIDVLDLASGHIDRLRLPAPNDGREVRDIVPLPDGRLLVATRGVAAINPATKVVTPSAIPCLEGQVINAMIAGPGEVFTGSYDGLTRVDLATGQCQRFRHDPADPKSLPNDNIRALLLLPGGRLAVGTAAGLAVTDGRGGFYNHRPDPNDPDRLSHGYITGLAADRQGRVWLSTAGGGLVVTDAEDLGGKPHFRAIRRRNGLPHDNIGSVGVDDKGRIWFTTPSRVGLLNPQDGRVTLFGDRDGASLKFYVVKDTKAGPGGQMLLGGLGGLALLDPASGANPPPAALRITGMEINHQPLPPARLPEPGRTLTLPASGRNLSVEFSLLDFRSPVDVRYRHRLEGFDQGWLDSTSRAPAAAYTNLPPGDYTLRIEALQAGMEAPLATQSLRVSIAPFWYETLWAQLGGVVLGIGVVIVIVQVRTTVLRRQRSKLESEIVERTRDLMAANERLDTLASTDPLTGLLNRRRFLEMAAAEQQRAGRHDRPLSLLLIDLDHFKRVNDQHGHRMGDAVLRTTAAILTAAIRSSDLAARFGGEELVLLLPETDLAGAAGMAERLRKAFAATATDLDGKEVHITASLGVAGWQGPGESLDALIHRADQALYAAKHAGRDKVMIAAGTM